MFSSKAHGVRLRLHSRATIVPVDVSELELNHSTGWDEHPYCRQTQKVIFRFFIYNLLVFKSK